MRRSFPPDSDYAECVTVSTVVMRHADAAAIIACGHQSGTRSLQSADMYGTPKQSTGQSTACGKRTKVSIYRKEDEYISRSILTMRGIRLNLQFVKTL